MPNRVICAALLLVSTASFGAPRAYTPSPSAGASDQRKNHWSLAEWVEQRDHMRLMDLWLALHSPSPYEFYVGGSYSAGKRITTDYYGGWDFYAVGYASIFGLEARAELTNLPHRYTGLFNLRVFGLHAQSTNLTLFGGAKGETRDNVKVWNPVAGASLTFYFVRAFGVEALYKHYFATSSDTAPLGGIEASGDRYEAGAFLDFRFVRFFADYFRETETDNPTLTRLGVTAGTKIFF